ncbi:MAG: NTP transferase domain-containing protein [Candidatus Aminicenantes bacterium]|nr:NTP transferase domain-containing protein [Candidatus Aminicenantes bacterium]
MGQEIKAVVLAAGKSKRMKSGFTKVVHRILGKEIINYLIDSLTTVGLGEENITIVVGDNSAEIKAVVKRNVRYAIQAEQLGTGHALLSAKKQIEDFSGHLVVSVGDNPYVNSYELQKLIREHREKNAACTFISAVFPHVPPPYGRVIRDEKGNVSDVVEEIEATPEQLKIREVNSSIYIFDNNVTFPLLYEIDNKNEKGEYYLTDIIKILKKRNYRIHAVKADDYAISIGINNKWELQQAQEKFNRENLKRLAEEEGVTIFQPESVTIECDVEIGRDTVVYPSTYLASGTRIGSNCRIGPFVYLKNATIADNEEISFKKINGR